jgi:hypothetical protein
MHLCIIPNVAVIDPTEPHSIDMFRRWIKVGQRLYQPGRKVLVQQQLHDATVSNFRSRSAANARQARMSSSVR